MLQKDGQKEGWTDGQVTISLHNFVGEGIINLCQFTVGFTELSKMCLMINIYNQHPILRQDSLLSRSIKMYIN